MTDSSESLRLNNQLCFSLYSASRALTALYRELLAPLGVTYPQYLVLLALWEQSPQTVSELGAQLQLDSGTLSPLLKRLELLGLVTRERATDDERVVLVALTTRGWSLRAQAVPVPAVVSEATGLDNAHLMQLRDEVQGIADRVRSAIPAENAGTPRAPRAPRAQ
ncbi:MarR family winged helix-turn-helix transcriptional regulator [Flexivirga aerilata]|uniref:MarR family winged helix-turn-helix transcriptional regulator n=1 Tax=Flexivirga aerilata TaxID=1656889 RepID=UPI0031B56BD0